jgi:endonuclease-3
MRKKERADFILSFLDIAYPETPIPLNHKNNFELLVAVLLSAQCTDERVNKVTPILFAKADNPIIMSKMSIEEINHVD